MIPKSLPNKGASRIMWGVEILSQGFGIVGKDTKKRTVSNGKRGSVI